MNEGYSEPVNLFTVTALPPANRKSAVFADVAAPVLQYEEAEAQRMLPEAAEAKSRSQIQEARLKQLQSDAAKAKPEEAPMLEQAASTLARDLATATTPVIPRFVAQDTTPERLATLLMENGGRIAILSPEGDVFDLMDGRYGGKGLPNFGVYLNGHAGDDFRVDRVNRKTEFIKKPALTLGLAVQPEVIRGLAERRSFRGRGLLGRFLYALPKSLVGKRDPDPPAMSSAVRDAYRQKVLALLSLRQGQTGESEAYPLPMSAGADQLRLAFTARIEPHLADYGELGAMTDWGGKLVGAVVRVAGLLHMAKHAGEPEPWRTPVEEETMRRAIDIGNYLIAHAKAAYAQMGADPLVEEARAVLAWIERKGVAHFTRRDVFEGTKGRFKRVDKMAPALDLLIQHGYLHEKSVPDRAGPGRRPGPTYEVNPLPPSAHSQYSQNAIAEIVIPLPDDASGAVDLGAARDSANIANGFVVPEISGAETSVGNGSEPLAGEETPEPLDFANGNQDAEYEEGVL